MTGNRKSGTLYMVAASVLFSIGGLFIKLVPWHPIAINGGRSLISVIVVSLFLYKIKHKIKFNRYVLLGALCMCGTTNLYSCANKLTTAANTIVLQFTAPIFIIFFMWLFFKERPKKLDIITCCVVLVGILFFFVDSMSAGGMLGNVLAVLSGASFAGVFMMNTFPDGDSFSSILIGQAASVVIGLPFIFMETNFSASAIGGVVILGVFQLGLAYICLAKGLERVSPITGILITGIEPILNPIWVAIFYGEKISGLAFVGAIIVILAIIVYNLIKNKKEQEEVVFTNS